jgi:hypothetical protein
VEAWRQRLASQPTVLNVLVTDLALRQQLGARPFAAADHSAYRDQVLDEFLKPVPPTFTDVSVLVKLLTIYPRAIVHGVFFLCIYNMYTYWLVLTGRIEL